MTKIKKVKRKKKYQVNVNRKRLRNKLRKLPAIECPQIKQSWEVTKSARTNLTQMGLAYDANNSIKVPSVKKDLIKEAKSKINGNESLPEQEKDEDVTLGKLHVQKELEAKAKAPRQRLLKLPNSQVQFITYLMDKYGEDYKAMVRDMKNYDQLTWKQIRAKIKLFKGIPEQYNEYLHKKST